MTEDRFVVKDTSSRNIHQKGSLEIKKQFTIKIINKQFANRDHQPKDFAEYKKMYLFHRRKKFMVHCARLEIAERYKEAKLLGKHMKKKIWALWEFSSILTVSEFINKQTATISASLAKS